MVGDEEEEEEEEEGSGCSCSGCWAALGSDVGGDVVVVEERGSMEEEDGGSWCGLLSEASFGSSFGLGASSEDEGGGLVE